MRMFSLSRAQRIGAVIFSVTFVAALRSALDPILGDDLPLFFFSFPIILAAWLGGLWSGLLATVLSLVIGDYLFISPRGSFLYTDDPITLNRLSFMFFFGVTFSLMAEQFKRSVKLEKDIMERSRLLIEGVEDYALLMLDSRGRVIIWNSGAERITGYQEHEILGIDISIFFTSEEVEEAKPRRELDVAAGDGRCQGEGWRVRKDGSRFWANVVTTSLWEESGRLRGFATVMRDISRRKEVEEERERLLRQEKMAREEAESAVRLKDEFLSTISHELRTPLTSILGWAILGARGSVPDHQTRHAMDVIAKNARSQSQLIDDILDTSRIITGDLQLDAQPVDIESVFQAAVDVVRPMR